MTGDGRDASASIQPVRAVSWDRNASRKSRVVPVRAAPRRQGYEEDDMYLLLVIGVIVLHAAFAPLLGLLHGQSLKEWWRS